MVQPKICDHYLFSWLHILHCTVVIILGNLYSINPKLLLPCVYYDTMIMQFYY